MATVPRPMPPGGPMGPGPGGPRPPGMGGPGGPGGPGALPGPLLQQAMAGLAGGMPGADPAMALRSLQQTPLPDIVEVAIKRGEEAVGVAMQQVYQRSPEVAKELASALMNLKQAKAKLMALPREEIPLPPAGLPMAGPMFGGPAPGPAPMPPGG